MSFSVSAVVLTRAEEEATANQGSDHHYCGGNQNLPPGALRWPCRRCLPRRKCRLLLAARGTRFCGRRSGCQFVCVINDGRHSGPAGLCLALKAFHVGTHIIGPCRSQKRRRPRATTLTLTRLYESRNSSSRIRDRFELLGAIGAVELPGDADGPFDQVSLEIVLRLEAVVPAVEAELEGLGVLAGKDEGLCGQAVLEGVEPKIRPCPRRSWPWCSSVRCGGWPRRRGWPCVVSVGEDVVVMAVCPRCGIDRLRPWPPRDRESGRRRRRDGRVPHMIRTNAVIVA